jgi:hypothetical protein
MAIISGSENKDAEFFNVQLSCCYIEASSWR